MILSVRIQEMIDEAYKEAYDKAYKEAYAKAYKEAYDKAYAEAYKETVAASDIKVQRYLIKQMMDRGRTIQEIAEAIGLSEAEVRKLADKSS